MEQDGEAQLEVSERDLKALLLNLISVTGEAKKLRVERDQLQHKIDESSGVQDRNFAVAHSKADQDQLEPETDMVVTSAVQGDGQIVQMKKQSGPGESGSKKETEKPLNEKLTAVNCTDSGIASRSGLSPDLCEQPQTPRAFVMPPDSAISTSSSSKLPDILLPERLSENIDVTSASPGGKSSHLPGLQSESQVDGSSPFALSLHEDAFDSDIPQHSDLQKLYRATSYRQDDRTTNKGKKKMKKTGSHESYFPSDVSNNRKAEYQRKPRKFSTPTNTSNVMAQGKGDNIIMAFLPPVVSTNILNQVTRELRCVKKEHSSLGEKEKAMETKIQLLEENLESLMTEVKAKDKMLEEQKRATDQDQIERHKQACMVKAKDKMLEEQKRATDQDERHKQASMEIKKQLDDANRRNTILEEMLNDERKRFNRDEEHWKKEKAKLEKQIKMQD